MCRRATGRSQRHAADAQSANLLNSIVRARRDDGINLLARRQGRERPTCRWLNHDLQESVGTRKDRRFAQSGLTGPLHCIPAIVKDNFETIGMQSADGSLSLQGFISKVLPAGVTFFGGHGMRRR